MYIPRHFENTADFVVENILSEFTFSVLVSLGASLQVTHLPLLRVDDGTEYGKIIGHVAKPNPHTQLIDGNTPALAIFSGPHAYVSPNWYASENMVPTWNYAAVHVHGRPQAVGDPEGALRILNAMVEAFETDATGNWRTSQMSPRKLQGQLNGIVAFEMPIERIEAKAKMSQNRTAADIQGVVGGLTESAFELDRQTAEWMLKINGLGEKGS